MHEQSALINTLPIDHLENGNSMPVHANEVFQTAEQLEASVATAYDSGAIATIEQADDTRHRISYHVNVDDLTPGCRAAFKEADVKYGKYGKFKDFEFKDPLAVASGISEKLRSNIIEDIARDNGWYLQKQELRETIENGQITEAYGLTFEDKTIPLVNFTDQLLTLEQVENIRSAVEKVANVTKGTILERTHMIYIESADKMGNNNGAAQLMSGTIAINSDVLAGKFDAKNVEVNRTISHLGPYLEQLTVHELGHIIDSDISDSSLLFNGALGWESKLVHIAPDTPDPESPNIKTRLIHKRGFPSAKTKVLSDGGMQEVSTIDHFGTEVFLNSKPVTKYGNTDHREDFAESFIPFVLDEERLVLDALRHNAVANIVHDISGLHGGPILITAGKIDSHKILERSATLPVDPVSYRVQIYVDGLEYMNAKKDPSIKADKVKVSMPTWQNVNRNITDDFGNEVSGRQRVLSI